MSALIALVQGWTGELGPFTLKGDGVALNLTGLTITPQIRNASGTLYNGGGTLRKDDDVSTGKVWYTPIATDFAPAGRRPFTLRFRVVSSDSVVFFPSGEAAEITVRQE